MNILTTVFLGDANAKVWFPNSVLATKPISNFYRSPDMGDCFDFIVSASTTAEKIGLLKSRIEKYVFSFLSSTIKLSEIAKKLPERLTVGANFRKCCNALYILDGIASVMLSGWCGIAFKLYARVQQAGITQPMSM